ncbi:MAG TPA: aldo/keto reductase [Gemmatales bacterium]|nr:aldo/keto reductase [Gemmatales bacterium]
MPIPKLFFGNLSTPLALGLLRLSTEGRPTEAGAVSLIHLALDAGIRLLDTADAYCLNHKDLHYGEQLARQAVETWKGPKKEVRILTKVGMTRPKGKWVPDGKPEHLRKAVDNCLQALGVERLFLLQLHVHDSRVPFEETLAALAELQKTGKVEHLGLCNTTVGEIQQASRHFKVAVVQNELSISVRKSAQDGTLVYSQQQGIPFLAYRLLGGIAKVEKLTDNKVLQPIAAKHGVTPQQIALAMVQTAGANVIPLIGATKSASLKSSVAAMKLKLDDEDREVLEKKYSFNSKVAVATPSRNPSPPTPLPGGARGAKMGEVVLLMGIQGAGKSELVAEYEKQDYARLNRDVLGGKLEDLIPKMHELIELGERRIVLDNTYPTRISRAQVIAVAHEHGIPVVCRFLNTPIEEARINVVSRMLGRYDKLLGPDEMKALAKTDPNLPPPAALKRWADSFEAPNVDEGFAKVEVIPFVRRPVVGHTQKGLLLDVDGTIRHTKSGEKYPRSADDVELLPGRKEVLKKWIKDGYQLFFISNQSGVSSGKVTTEQVEAAMARTIKLLELPVVEAIYCPHKAFPVLCFCRKPLPGLGVYLMRKHRLAQEHLTVVGDLGSDEQFAKAIGAKYVDVNEFFK